MERNDDDGQREVEHLTSVMLLVTLRAWSSRPKAKRQLRSQMPAYCIREFPTGSSLQAFHHTHGASRISKTFSGDPAVASKSSTVAESKQTAACTASLRRSPCHCRVPKSCSTAASRSRPGRSPVPAKGTGACDRAAPWQSTTLRAGVDGDHHSL